MELSLVTATPTETFAEPSASLATPVNKTPLLPCLGCGGKWITHRFVEKRKVNLDSPKLNLIFACLACHTERVYGQEH
jgi:hypothetical protein